MSKVNKFIPFGDKIQIEPLEQDTLLGQEKKFHEVGKVIAVGEFVYFCKPGDLLYFSAWGFRETPEIDGVKYCVVPENSEFIIGKVNGKK